MTEREMREKLKAFIDTLCPDAHKMLSPKFFSDKTGIHYGPELSEMLHEISKENDKLERWAVLFEFGDEYEIEEEDLAHYDATGELVHPHTGEMVKDAVEHLSIFYAARAPEIEQPAL